MMTNQPDNVTIAALRQLVARSYDALARSHSALGDGVATDSAELLHDLRAVVEAPGIPAADRAVSPRVAGDLLVGDRFRFINDMTKYAGVCELVRIAPCTYRRVVHGVGRHEWIQVDTRAQIIEL